MVIEAPQADQIIFGIITIGVIGLISDVAFKRANRKMFGWASL
jgi:NitT/TauT family transport system permease protein